MIHEHDHSLFHTPSHSHQVRANGSKCRQGWLRSSRASPKVYASQVRGAPVCLVDECSDLVGDTLGGLGEASLGSGQIPTVLRDTVAHVLGKVEVTGLVDEVEAGALAGPLAVVKQIHWGGVSESLASCQGGNSSNKSCDNLQACRFCGLCSTLGFVASISGCESDLAVYT